MSRYTKEHYEDVAAILLPHCPGNSQIGQIVKDFADLFAADNPPKCIHCGRSGAEAVGLCLGPQDYLNHEVAGGFNCEQFLTACGLEPTQSIPPRVVPKQVLEHYGLD